MTDLAPESTLSPIDAPDDQEDLARRHRESLFPSVGLYYSESIELRRGERVERPTLPVPARSPTLGYP